MVFDNDTEVRYNHDKALIDLVSSIQSAGPPRR